MLDVIDPKVLVAAGIFVSVICFMLLGGLALSIKSWISPPSIPNELAPQNTTFAADTTAASDVFERCAGYSAITYDTNPTCGRIIYRCPECNQTGCKSDVTGECSHEKFTHNICANCGTEVE